MSDALFITFAGMGLVFAGLILLWFLMAFLVRITQTKTVNKSEPEISHLPDLSDLEGNQKRKATAAAAAVSVAMLQKTFLNYKHEEKGAISPWQASYRSIQTQQNRSIIRRKDHPYENPGPHRG